MSTSSTGTKFLHFRAIDERGNVNPHGGVTIAYQTDQSGATYYGTARCSEDDNFVKRAGRRLAAFRLSQMSYPHTGVVLGTTDEKEFAHYMGAFIRDSFGYVRKFSRKNRKHG